MVIARRAFTQWSRFLVIKAVRSVCKQFRTAGWVRYILMFVGTTDRIKRPARVLLDDLRWREHLHA